MIQTKKEKQNPRPDEQAVAVAFEADFLIG
jgi:hypothetical protein